MPAAARHFAKGALIQRFKPGGPSGRNLSSLDPPSRGVFDPVSLPLARSSLGHPVEDRFPQS